MPLQFSRTELLLGADSIEKLAASRVAVFGVGGVGGFAAEALIRSGVGAMDLIDCDIVSESNINRQIIALHSTVGRYKTEVARERLLDINPNAQIRAINMFYTPETASRLDFTRYDYVIDAIDTVTGKLELVMNAERCGVPIISSMGAGNKLDPTAFEVADIYSTSVCPLARVMRAELKKRGIKRLKVVYSKEKPIAPSAAAIAKATADEALEAGKPPPGSCAFVPSVVGLIIAGEVIKDLAAEFLK